MHVLVVGGTGMLKEVSLWLANQGHEVSVIARIHSPRWKSLLYDALSAAARIHPVGTNYLNSNDLERCIQQAIRLRGPIELAVFWIHSDAPDAFQVIADEIDRNTKVPWRLFHVRGSTAHIEPNPPALPPNCGYREVVLGFICEDGGSRWLTHREICTGVIEAIQHDQERTIVGTVEPWEERPR
ncbi:short-chain dehydrogenase [Alicyclobacillus sp. SP_1]|uniref:short-chain dehydrogenase n=1 Tax=Alicyclobacillus sp. SP_1 TaxID=2942475 RepID=UPI002157C08D|nr:short-chain dehydrogenase [Alicyclobacillus sp. SP_1]